MHARKYLGCLKEMVFRNMEVKGNSGEGSERKEDSCTENFATIILENTYIIKRMLVKT